jgi:hypothetical protein
MQQEEFYIGWQAETPPSFARVVRRCVAGLCVLVPAIAVLVAVFQKGFSNGVFEFGTTTTVEGIYEESPYPFLLVHCGNDATGRPLQQQILLVGKGKSGFAENPAEPVRPGKPVRVSGFLIYNDGRVAMEVHKVEPAEAVEVGQREETQSFGRVTLRGEITDPKCLLGVMNPGEGKPHRDCAVRCIAGGIPPLLKVSNSKGDAEYYLLTGPDGTRAGDDILPFVGDGVQICGNLVQHGGWLTLQADFSTLQRIGKGSLNTTALCQ